MLSMFDLAGENNNFFFMIWNRNVESLLRAPNLEFTKFTISKLQGIKFFGLSRLKDENIYKTTHDVLNKNNIIFRFNDMKKSVYFIFCLV